MKVNFKVDVLDFKKIGRIDGFWTPTRYMDLLQLMEYDDVPSIAEADLEELCLLALNENTPEESAKIVLGHIFKDNLRNGQVNALAHDIMDEKLWEEYSDISLHERIFYAGQLLYQAYGGGTFTRPEAVSFKLHVSSPVMDNSLFGDNQINATLIRLLVQGMSKNTLIARLFEDQIHKGTFREAGDIIWQLQDYHKGGRREFHIISSMYWFAELKFVDSFQAELALPRDMV